MQGRLDEAIGAFASGSRIEPTSPCTSGLLYTLWFHPGHRPIDVFNEHRRWAKQFADPLTAACAAA